MAVVIEDSAEFHDAWAYEDLFEVSTTPAGSNRLALMLFGIRSFQSYTSTPTYAGSGSVTLEATGEFGSPNETVYCYTYDSEPATSSGTWSATLNTNRKALMYSFALSGVDQTTPISDSDTESGSSLSSASGTVTSTSGDLVLAMSVWKNDNGGTTVNQGTELFDEYDGAITSMCASHFTATGSSTTITHTPAGGATEGAILVVNVAQAETSQTVTLPFMDFGATFYDPTVSNAAPAATGGGTPSTNSVVHTRRRR